jgi:hypothetical protein
MLGRRGGVLGIIPGMENSTRPDQKKLDPIWPGLACGPVLGLDFEPKHQGGSGMDLAYWCFREGARPEARQDFAMMGWAGPEI